MHARSRLLICLDKGDTCRDFTVIGADDQPGAWAGFAQHAFELEVRYYIAIFGQAETPVDPVERSFDSRRDDHGISRKVDYFILDIKLDGFGLALGPAQGAPQAAAAAKASFRFPQGPFLVESQFHLTVVVPALFHPDFKKVPAR
jgi:hypothetical protein